MVGERLAARRNLRSRRGGLLQFLLVTAVLGAGAVAVAMLDTGGASLSGAAHIADGDTLTIDRQRIRLVGIDAPELAQTCKDRAGADWPCGRIAREHLVGLTSGKAVSCLSEGRDKYGRLLGRCSAADQDLGAAMVEAGLAVSYGDYKLRETVARVERRGLWDGSFEMPQEWRRTKGAGQEGFDVIAWLLSWLPG